MPRFKQGCVYNSHSVNMSWENVFSVASYHCFPYCLIQSINHSITHKLFIEYLICNMDSSRYREYIRNKRDKNSCPHGAYYRKGETINTLTYYILLILVIIGIKKLVGAEGLG